MGLAAPVLFSEPGSPLAGLYSQWKARVGDDIETMIRMALTVWRAVSWAAIVLIAVASPLVLFSTTRAEGGVPIPAPAGTTWSIIAGYNTATHSEADQQDPHAIDIVRTDASTDWTPVLSPVDGEVTWSDNNGLTIQDSNGYAHLLVHLDPDDHITRGLRVRVGDQVGLVFPVGYDANGGVAHIHYAIHETYGGGYLGRTIPFTRPYAIEGRELHWSDEYNLHSGVEFTSTNSPNWTAPTDESPDVDDEPVAVAEPEPEPVWTMPADAPVGGWRTVGVSRDTSVAGLEKMLDGPLSALVVHNARDGSYELFDPSDPGSADVAVRSLQAGQAVWALVDPFSAWLPAPPSAPRQVTIRLLAGANLISWQGPDRDVGAALRNVAHFSRAYRYDPYTERWQFWSPEAPDFVNTLERLQSGDALYVVVRVGSVWTQLP
ncbi:MAG: M23 family metallopeptidase [Chloroflexi bacterium]|nr:M23 family metallopeptidase [Chloroflexota bacterium]